MVAAIYKRVEYKEQIEEIVENTLRKITESHRNTVDIMFFQTEDSNLGRNLGRIRVYYLQSLNQNQWLNSEVMHVIFDHVAAATRSYSRLSIHCYEARVIRISFGKTNLKFIYCRHWFWITVYLKKRLIICLDSFNKTKKVVMFARAFFYYLRQFEK